MCTRGQLKRDGSSGRKAVRTGRALNPLRRIFRKAKYADKKNLSVFKRFGKTDISEMPSQQSRMPRGNNFVPKGNDSARRRSLLGVRK